MTPRLGLQRSRLEVRDERKKRSVESNYDHRQPFRSLTASRYRLNEKEKLYVPPP